MKKIAYFSLFVSKYGHFIGTLEIVELFNGFKTRQCNSNGSRLILIIQVPLEQFIEVAKSVFIHIYFIACATNRLKYALLILFSPLINEKFIAFNYSILYLKWWWWWRWSFSNCDAKRQPISNFATNICNKSENHIKIQLTIV